MHLLLAPLGMPDRDLPGYNCHRLSKPSLAEISHIGKVFIELPAIPVVKSPASYTRYFFIGGTGLAGL